MNDLRKLFSIIREDRSAFFRSLAIYSSWAIFPIVNVFMFTKITEYIELGDKGVLKQYIILYILIIGFIWIWAYVVKYRGWIENIGIYAKIIHRKYLSQFIYLDNVGYEKVGTGKFVSILEKGINTRGMILDVAINYGTAFILTMTYIIYILIKIDVKYLFWFMIICLLVSLFGYWMNEKMLVARRDRVTALNGYVKYLVKIIMSKYEIMQVGLRFQDLNKLDGEQDKAVQANRNMQPYVQLFFRFPALLFPLLKITLLRIIGTGIIDGSATYTELVGAGTALGLLESLMTKWLKFYKDFTKDFDLVKRMWETFDNIGMIEGYEDGDEFTYKLGDIDIKNMTYSYNIDKVFSDFSLTIQGGKKTALVGVSGSGKSTLVKLIAGYLRPDSGSIMVDGQDLTDVSLKSYYKHIGYLTQEPSVFDGTVWENLTYAIENPHPDPLPNTPRTSSLGEGDVDDLMKRVDEAIAYAKCEFVYDFQDGLETEIGERGVRLSGGQRQRLAIAKIFLKDPEIIILDEPTSALDSFSEEGITEAMHNLFAGRTVIIIAHRLQTVKEADDIILLADGKVSERGTHDELVSQGGQYAKMLELQSGF